MANQISKNIILPRSVIREKEGIVILPLKKWREIKRLLEDLEMYRSERLVKKIEKRRKEKESSKGIGKISASNS